MQTLRNVAVFNDFLQLIAQLLIIYCCIFFTSHTRTCKHAHARD